MRTGEIFAGELRAHERLMLNDETLDGAKAKGITRLPLLRLFCRTIFFCLSSLLSLFSRKRFDFFDVHAVIPIHLYRAKASAPHQIVNRSARHAAHLRRFGLADQRLARLLLLLTLIIHLMILPPPVATINGATP